MVTKTSESFELSMHSIGQGNVILEYVIPDEKAVLAEWHKIEVCKGSLTVWALNAYFSDSQNAAFELQV